jgi:hypothetical protein
MRRLTYKFESVNTRVYMRYVRLRLMLEEYYLLGYNAV